jgi:hypothetical protein
VENVISQRAQNLVHAGHMVLNCVSDYTGTPGVWREGIDLVGQFQEFIGLQVEFLNFR